MHIECDQDGALDLLAKSFESSKNPNYNNDIKSLLEKVDTTKTDTKSWTSFTYKIKLRLNKLSEQKEADQKKRPPSLASFHRSIREEKSNGTFKFLHLLIIGKNFQL